MKNISSQNPTVIPPLHIFHTGGAGVGKSHIIKSIHASVSKTLCYRSMSPDKPKVLLLAPTSVAAINISGTTIHSGLGIPIECYGPEVPKLADKRKKRLLNNIRIGCLAEEDEELLKSRFMESKDENFLHDAVHLYTENAPRGT